MTSDRSFFHLHYIYLSTEHLFSFQQAFKNAMSLSKRDIKKYSEYTCSEQKKVQKIV